MKKIINILALVLICTSAFAHPIKMTTGKLQIETQNKTGLLTLNFFIDDFEAALRKLYPQPPFNYTEPDEIMKATISRYVLDNFSLTIDEQTVLLELSSIKKIEDNVCQVAFKCELSGITSFKEFTIKDVLLFESFRKQSNILHVKVNQKTPKILQFYPAMPVRRVNP